MPAVALGAALARSSSTATPAVPFWLQIVTIVLAPVLALAGVAFGAGLSRSGEEMQWLRNSRLQAYNSFLLACNSYDIAAGRLTESRRLGDRGTQSASREDALRAMRDVITYRESVLLLGSPGVQASCKVTVTAINAVNERVGMLISGTNDVTGRSDIDKMLREAVTSELIPRRPRLWPSGKKQE